MSPAAPLVESWYSARLRERILHRVTVFLTYGEQVLSGYCQWQIPVWSGWIIETDATARLIRDTATLGDLDGKGRARQRPMAAFDYSGRTFVFGEWGHWEAVTPSLHSIDNVEITTILGS